MNLVYLIGEPGSGKSTLLAALTDGIPSVDEPKPFARICWNPEGVPVWELGARRPSFSGTDALSMSVQPRVVEWLAKDRPSLVIGEGDRLANPKFFAAVAGLGYKVDVVRLVIPSVIAAERRNARAVALGAAPQSAAWIKGRRSKVANLAAAVLEAGQARLWSVNAAQPVADLVRVLQGMELPPLMALAAVGSPR